MKTGVKITNAVGIMAACFVGQGVLQGGIGPQPSSTDYEVKRVVITNEISRTVKTLKKGTPAPTFQGITSLWQRDFSAGKGQISGGLSPDQMLFALAGFRACRRNPLGPCRLVLRQRQLRRHLAHHPTGDAA